MGGSGVQFGAEGGFLCGIELRAFGVAEQAVEAAGDVAEMERDRSEAEGTGVEFGFAEGRAPFCAVFGCEFERVKNSALDGVYFGERAAEPGFDSG